MTRLDRIPEAYLGIERSLMGRRWTGPDAAIDRASEAICQAASLPRPLARVLARSGVAPAEAEGYLAPKLKHLMPDPRRMKDCAKAAARLNRAAERAEKVAVFADYDVDGASSAALLIDWFASRGREVTLHVPDRIAEGYGPNAPAMARLSADHDLIVCVDCGTMAHDALAAASCDVVILDHHLGGESLPKALAVVNPNRADEEGDLGLLCAAAVTFLTLVEADRQAREAGAEVRSLTPMLDLVALATVADVAPLRGVNRAFVRAGLQVMAGRGRTGLAALCDAARLNCAPSAHHLGFVLGPRLNASGRIGRADAATRLLTCGCPHDARARADRLGEINDERKRIEAQVRASALAQAEARGGPLAWAVGAGWHPGVVGIVASRMAERMSRPAVVLGMAEGEVKGSGRSVPGIDLGRAVARLVHEGLIEKGGGHEQAAGLTMTEAQVGPAMERLSELLERQGAGAAGPRDLALDGTIMPGAATTDLCDALERAGPYGQGAPAPRFALPDMRIAFAREVGEGHLKLALTDGTAKIDAIAFGGCTGPLAAMLSHGGARFHVAGRLEINEWQGRRSAQLQVVDAAPCSG